MKFEMKSLPKDREEEYKNKAEEVSEKVSRMLRRMKRIEEKDLNEDENGDIQSTNGQAQNTETLNSARSKPKKKVSGLIGSKNNLYSSGKNINFYEDEEEKYAEPP